MTLAVIGGAGYIGAHVVRLIQQRGEDVVVVDDLSTGRADRIGDARLVQLEVSAPGAEERIAEVLRESGARGVIHFAAQKQVGQSVEQPLRYYRQNVGGLVNVLSAMRTAGVDRFVFSSSAAAYGIPDADPVPEDVTMAPINPYGETKLIGEWMIADAARAYGLRGAALRYFNVAGSGWDDLGDPAVLNLIPMVFDRLERGQAPVLFGTDYPTPDGTCVRDYVHVLDLADAHLAVLDYLEREDRPHLAFNIGTGQGASVREVIDEIGKVTGLDATPEIKDRRAGDPPRLVADVKRMTETLGWTAEHDLPSIVASAWAAWKHDRG